MRLLLFSVVGALAAQNLTCQMTSAYPPPANASVPWYEVNLDLPAKDRWTAIVTPLAPKIADLLKVITKLVPDKYLQPLLDKCAESAKEEFLDRFPEDYGDELQAIADDTKIHICEIILYNLAYEILGGCTSIIAQDPSGYIRQARNLDFGLGPYNATEGQWQLTDALRPLIFNANFTKGGKSVYTGTHYAGYIGFTTAVKPGAFGLTVDTRFDDTYSKFLIQWLKDRTDTANFLTFLTRQMFETQTNFTGALAFMSSHNMVGPSYTILAGVNPGEGAVITNGPNRTTPVDVWMLSKGLPKDKPYYVLQTNYDHWVEPPFFDNRNAPAMDCMNKLGQAGMTKANIYNVLHAHPNRNRLTTYTTLMDARKGELETSIQFCKEKGCVPW